MDTNDNLNEITDSEITNPLAVDMTKAFATSAAAAAGTVVGFVAVGFIAGKIQSLSARRAAKKAAATQENN